MLPNMDMAASKLETDLMEGHNYIDRNINSCQVTKPECQLLTLFLRAHDSFLNFFYHITLIIKNFKIMYYLV